MNLKITSITTRCETLIEQNFVLAVNMRGLAYPIPALSHHRCEIIICLSVSTYNKAIDRYNLDYWQVYLGS